jgi:hypothetical protein
MNTQSNAYVRKLSSTTLLVLLLASAVLAFLPIAAVHGSTGHPDIGIVTTQANLTTFAPAAAYVNVTAGSSAVAGNDCTATFPGSCAASGYLAINFSSGGLLFSGSQFALYLSKDGFSQITAGDIPYAGGLTDKAQFSVSALAGSGITTVKETNGTFYLGNGPGAGVPGYLSGPIPTHISNAYKYIKIYDGSATSVAVSKEYISIMPGISLSPTTGAAGTSVVISGGGFPMNTLVDINYSYTFHPWNGSPKTMTGQWVTGISTGSGFFATTATIVDTKQAVNPPSSASVIPTVNITMTACTHTYAPHHAPPTLRTFYSTATANFFESTRAFTQEFSYRPDGSVGGSATNGPYGNDTGTTSVTPVLNDLPVLDAYVTGSIGLEGNYSAIGYPVTVWIGSTQLATATPNGVSGHWVVNFTVPPLPRGSSNIVQVINNGVTYEFNINIVPTLILTPSKGPIGTTVTITAYGFTPTNHKAPVVLYWYEHNFGDGFNYWLANTTVGINGAFNSTSPVQFIVPHSYGGGHEVNASSVCLGICKAGGNTSAIPSADILGTAVFTVTPTLTICSPSTCGAGYINSDTVSVNANTRTMLMANGTGFGFACGAGCWEPWYQVNIDNALYSDFETSAAVNGNLYMNFTAAGFQPGLHQVELYACTPYNTYSQCVGAPVAVAYFNVTTIGAYIGGGGSLPSSVVADIGTIKDNVATILDTVNTISDNVNTISTSIGTIKDDVATILGWGPTITGMDTHINTIIGDLATLTTAVNTAASNAQAASTAATAASTAATAAGTAATDAKNSVSSTETYVLVVAVLAAITLVLELAILVRKLD